MKKTLFSTVIALLGAALIPSAHATPISYTTGDLILGFETTGGNSSGGKVNLLIDLGQYASLGGFSTFNVAGDLNTVYGSNNWSSGQISFGAIGVTLAGSHYSNIYETAVGNTLLPVASGSTTTKQDYQALTGSLGSGYQNLILSANSNVWTGYGVEQLSSSATGAWGFYNPSASAFGISGENIETTIGGTLNLYDKIYSLSSPSVVGTPYTISVDASGNILVSAVPEPSTYALLFLGLLLVITSRLRGIKAQGILTNKNYFQRFPNVFRGAGEEKTNPLTMMKLKKKLLIMALAALSLGSASAATTYFSAVPSFQAVIDAAFLQFATNNGGGWVSYDFATWGKATNEIFTWVGGGVTNKIIVHYGQTGNIVQALTAPVSSPVKFGFFSPDIGSGLQSNALATNFQAPQAAFYDSAQTTTFFNGTSAGDGRTYGLVTGDTPVVAEGYAFFANTNWPVAGTTNATVTGGVATNVITYGNITSQQVRQLYSAGAVPLDYITGNTNDTTNAVFAFGRNFDAGTRLIWFNEVGLGVLTSVVQYQLVKTNGSNDVNLYPVETVDGVSSYSLGNSGYGLDSAMRGLFTNALASGPGIDLSGSFVGYSGNNYMIGMSSIHNATGSPGVKMLNYNGVVPSTANIENGTYSGWGFCRVGSSATVADTTSLSVVSSIITIVTSYSDAQLGAGNAAIANLKATRDTDGGNIYPTH